MQLTYRGIQYEANTSSISTTPGKAIGKYRGATLKKQDYTITSAPHLSSNLKYRGAYYQPVSDRSISTHLASAF